MKRALNAWPVSLLAALLLCAWAGAARGAEKFEDKALNLTLEAPEGFEKPTARPELPEVLGEIKVVYAHKDRPNNGGLMFLHHMAIPEDTPYDDFKARLAEALKERFGGGFKLVKQEDVEAAGRKGFMLDFEVPGNGDLPEQGGNFQHHVRWYLLRDGENHLVGLAFHSRETAWAELEPKFAAAFKTLKKAE